MKIVLKKILIWSLWSSSRKCLNSVSRAALPDGAFLVGFYQFGDEICRNGPFRPPGASQGSGNSFGCVRQFIWLSWQFIRLSRQFIRLGLHSNQGITKAIDLVGNSTGNSCHVRRKCGRGGWERVEGGRRAGEYLPFKGPSGTFLFRVP